MDPTRASSIDHGQPFDWGRTSEDYAVWRPNYPEVFFDRLAAFGVGLPDQRILDVGTGVGFLASEFARRGSRVVGIDVAEEQVAMAARRAAQLRVDVEYRVAPAEETGQPEAVFDIVTAGQCWLYFERPRIYDEVRRVLAPGGRLVTCHYSWLPREDAIARASEELVLKFNPKWTSADWSGNVPARPAWAEGEFRTVAMFTFDAEIPFTRERWRGRIRACRGVGAALPPEDVARFDAAHGELLTKIAPEEFTIRHRLDATFLEPL